MEDENEEREEEKGTGHHHQRNAGGHRNEDLQRLLQVSGYVQA
jgi:hypothetical protein